MPTDDEVTIPGRMGSCGATALQGCPVQADAGNLCRMWVSSLAGSHHPGRDCSPGAAVPPVSDSNCAICALYSIKRNADCCLAVGPPSYAFSVEPLSERNVPRDAVWRHRAHHLFHACHGRRGQIACVAVLCIQVQRHIAALLGNGDQIHCLHALKIVPEDTCSQISHLLTKRRAVMH